jgi:hypothetical protein
MTTKQVTGWRKAICRVCNDYRDVCPDCHSCEECIGHGFCVCDAEKEAERGTGNDG